jgi:chemotaxis protein histidine kinase CheA
VGFVLFLAVSSFRTAQGAAARGAVADLVRVWGAAAREVTTPDDHRRTPARERRRRMADALQDLDAALGGGLSSRVQAELAAHDEGEVRNALAEAARLREERQAAYQRSAERQRRTRERADRIAAVERGMREAARLRDDEARRETGAARELSLAAVRAEEVLQAHRRAVAEAAQRREAAEKLADEAVAWAEKERKAAEEATRQRTSAERAAAEARARAESDLRSAGRASQARSEAERQAREAAERAHRERAVSQEAVARRVEAEGLAAEAEMAQSEAVHRELAALEAAETAEKARDLAVARMDDATGPSRGPDRTLDLTTPAPLDVRESVAARVLSSGSSGPGRVISARVPGGAAGPSAPPHPDPSASDHHARNGRRSGSDSRAQTWDLGGASQTRTRGVRVVGAVLVPAAVAVKTLMAGTWWSHLDVVGSAALAAAGALTALGVWWLWMSTTPPFSLRRRSARRILAWQSVQRSHTDHAARLLAAIGDDEADGTDAWQEFEHRTGLVVPGATRAVVDPHMDPAALVRYLSARQREGLTTPQPLVVVAAVPLLTCLLPAALLVLVS